MTDRRRISAKADRFTESVIREMNRLAVAAGAVSLAQGFPDFACPPELKRARRVVWHTSGADRVRAGA